MSRTQRILDRFPNFYRTWDRNSLISQVVSASGKRIDEVENELFAVMRAHWVDKTLRIDLDYLGALYNIKRKLSETDSEFRSRLKRAIMEFKGGGTISAVLASVKNALGLPRDFPLELVENPQKEIQKEFGVRTGETWWQSSESVFDAIPNVEISVETKGAKITNPTIINTDIEESLVFRGIVQNGSKLRLGDGKAYLDGKDVTESLSTTTTTIPKLLRKGSVWRYVELLGKEIGVFDASSFDESLFPVGIATVKIVFKWTTHQPATFEIRVPKEALSLRGDNISMTEDVVNSIKATGVRATIKIIDGD